MSLPSHVEEVEENMNTIIMNVAAPAFEGNNHNDDHEEWKSNNQGEDESDGINDDNGYTDEIFLDAAEQGNEIGDVHSDDASDNILLSGLSKTASTKKDKQANDTANATSGNLADALLG